MQGAGGTFQASIPGPTSSSQSSQFAPHPTGDVWPGGCAWLAGMPCSSLLPLGAERCPSFPCLLGRVLCPHQSSSGCRQGAGRQWCVLLHKGTMLGSLPPPRHFLTGCAPASSPSERNLLGNGNRNRNCPGSSAKSSGGHGFPQGAAVGESWPCWGGKQHVGWELSTSS